jgi:hypothetical protein
MKKKLLCFLAILLLTPFFFIKGVWFKQDHPSIVLIWNNNESYIFIEENIEFIESNMVGCLIYGVLDSLGMEISRRTQKSSNIIAFHIDRDGMRKTVSKGVNICCEMNFWEGKLLMIRGGSQPQVWKWNGDFFEPLGAAESSSIRESYVFSKPPKKPDPEWNSKYYLDRFRFPNNKNQFTFSSGNKTYTLFSERNERSVSYRLSCVTDHWEKVLNLSDGNYHLIGRRALDRVLSE